MGHERRLVALEVAQQPGDALSQAADAGHLAQALAPRPAAQGGKPAPASRPAPVSQAPLRPLQATYCRVGQGASARARAEAASRLQRVLETHRGVPRLGPALSAGGIAIAVNTTMLAGADAAGLKTAHGGLLRLLQNLGGWLAGLLGAPGWWSTSLVPFTSGATVQFGFHVFVGLLMAVVYAYLLEPVLPGRPWMKGLIYAALAWLQIPTKPPGYSERIPRTVLERNSPSVMLRLA